MSQVCTVCDGTGFLNISQVDDETLRMFDNTGDTAVIDSWMAQNEENDVQICGCCGDGCGWYGVPGEHYNNEDPPGHYGPYVYNGGLCECH